MAWWDEFDWEDVGEFDSPDVKDILFGEGDVVDERAQALFFEGVIDKDEGAYQDLLDYMWEEYGIDFEEAFDWQDFREWYG